MANPLIVLNIETKKKLDSIKIHPRETYNDIIERILKLSNHF